MSEITDDATNEVGLSSAEAENRKKSILGSMTVFEAMLIVSFVCIALATLVLFFELRSFGGGFPWRTTEFLKS